MAPSHSVLVLRHEPFEHLGHFERILTERNILFEYKDLGESLRGSLGSDGHSGVIVMGGPQSANDPSPELTAELDLISKAVADQVPILGICLGAQLIAKALGAKVYRNPVPEIGWAPVFFTESGRQDPIFSGLPSPTTFFHWHGETFDLPPGADWLAGSENCRHQAFRYGPNVYGVQFHPEITSEMIVDWSAQPVNCGDVNRLDGPIDPYAADSAPLARKVLDGWLATF